MISQEEDGWLIWLVFQETKYEWNFEAEIFEAIDFPVRFKLSTYLNHKGYLEDQDVSNASRKYGGNKYDQPNINTIKRNEFDA